MEKGVKAKKKRTRAKITPDMEAKIMSWAKVKYPGMQRTELAHKLQAEFGKGAPKEDVLVRKISWYRKNVEDEPLWSMASLNEEAPSFPPGALPAVVEVYKAIGHARAGVLSVREARWIARFSGLGKSVYELVDMATFYAEKELYDEVHNRPFSTRFLDDRFFGMKQPGMQVRKGVRREGPHNEEG